MSCRWQAPAESSQTPLGAEEAVAEELALPAVREEAGELRPEWPVEVAREPAVLA